MNGEIGNLDIFKKIIPCYLVTSVIIVLGLTIENLRFPALIFTLLFLAVTFFIIIRRSRILKDDIDQMIKFSETIASGDLKHKPFIEKGELKGLADTLVRVADRIKEELSEATESKKKIEMILENMKEGLLIIDENNTVLLASNSISQIFGVDPPVEGIQAIEILRDAELFLLLEETKTKRQILTREINLKSDKFFSVTASPVEMNKQEVCVLMTFYDITRLKKLEQIRKDLVANVAHEIKTPITAIKGFTETLLDGAINDKENATRFLKIIRRHSERLNSLVNDLLTLSRIESGEIKPELTDIDISEVIDSLLSLVSEKAKRKGLYLQKSLPSQIPLIRADKDKLIQILLNLVDNAIKFTDHGGVTVGSEISENKIIIFVEDTGIGIEKKHLSRLGERFYRVDMPRSRELGGTGLGLAIVKHLVRAHGWDMEIESTPEVGTKVKIYCESLLSKTK